jgi:hypothetical protein
MEHRHEADHQAVLVSAREATPLEHDVGPVLARVALRPVGRRGDVVQMEQCVDLGADQLPRLVAEHGERSGGAAANQPVAVELEDERVACIRYELLRALGLADR